MIDCQLHQVLQNYYLNQMVKVDEVEANSQGMVKIIDNAKFANKMHSWSEVLANVKVTKRAEKRKEELQNHNRKKYELLGMPNLSAMTAIQRAIYLAEHPEAQEPNDKKRQKIE